MLRKRLLLVVLLVLVFIPIFSNETIVLIIDSSGSMKDNDPNNIRLTAAELVVDRLINNTNLIIIDFDNDPHFVNKNNWKNWNATELKKSIQEIDSVGGTNIGKAIQKAADILNENNLKNAGVLLLSDGMGDYTGEVSGLSDKDIPVYTVSFMGENNAKLLSEIAKLTNGEYYKARTASDIIFTFNKFVTQLTGASTIDKGSILIETVGEISEFWLEEDSKDLNCSFYFTGKIGNISLVSPEGSLISAYNNIGKWSQSNNYAAISLKNPSAGKWKVLLDSMPEKGEMKYEISSSTLEKYSFQKLTDSSGFIELQIVNKQEIINLRNIVATANIISPNNTIIDISSAYSNGKIQYIPQEGEGSYTLRLSFTGINNKNEIVQRYLSSSLFIGDSIPPYIGKISLIRGNYITANLGKNVGNRTGLMCTIYQGDLLSQKLVAKGYVTFLQKESCDIEITQYFGFTNLKAGDFVQLNLENWKNDY